MLHQCCSYVWYHVGAKSVFSCPPCFPAGGLYAPCNTSHQDLQHCSAGRCHFWSALCGGFRDEKWKECRGNPDFNYTMNEWFKSLISLKPHGLNRCKYQSASRSLCWPPQREYPSCQVRSNIVIFYFKCFSHCTKAPWPVMYWIYLYG